MFHAVSKTAKGSRVTLSTLTVPWPRRPKLTDTKPCTAGQRGQIWKVSVSPTVYRIGVYAFLRHATAAVSKRPASQTHALDFCYSLVLLHLHTAPIGHAYTKEAPKPSAQGQRRVCSGEETQPDRWVFSPSSNITV